MFGFDRLSGTLVVCLLGFVVLGTGVALPWVGEMQLRVYVLGMESGLERRLGKVLLLLTVLGALGTLAATGPSGRWSAVAPVALAVGALAVAVAVFESPLATRRPPAIGVYLVLAGGLLVTGAAAVELSAGRTERVRPET